MSVRAAVTAAVVAVVATFALSACTTEDPEPAGGGTPSESTDPGTGPGTPTGGDSGTANAAVTVEISFEGDQVTPSGERVEVPVGEPVELVVTADAPGELHVHSDPEQEIPYDEGTSSHLIQIDRPGVVAVESHDLDQVIVQLEAR